MMLTDEYGNPLRPKVVTLDEVVNKPSWDSEDVEFLVAHQHLLDDEVLVKLGIMEEIKPLPAEVVAEQTKALKKKKKNVL
jgi:hypothetical protein